VPDFQDPADVLQANRTSDLLDRDKNA